MRVSGRILAGGALLALLSLVGSDVALARGGGGRGGGRGGGASARGAGRSLQRQSLKKKDPKELEALRERLRQMDYRDRDAPQDRGAL